MHENGKFGNAIYTKSTELNITYNTFMKCGPSASQSSDSCVLVADNKIIAKYLNGSYNFGVLGGSLISFYNGASGTEFKFCQSAHNTNDYGFFEMVELSYEVFSCNFRNTTNLINFCWIDKETTLNTCILIDVGKDRIGDGSLNFVNCFSNVKIQNYNLNIDTYVTFRTINFFTDSCKIRNNNECSCVNINYFDLSKIIDSVIILLFE